MIGGDIWVVSIILVGVVVFSSVLGLNIFQYLVIPSSEEGFTDKEEKKQEKIDRIKEEVNKALMENIGKPAVEKGEIKTELESGYKDRLEELEKFPPRFIKFEKETIQTDKLQDRRINDIREVLSSTIKTLVGDDVLPAGTSTNCNSAPVINPATGKVDPVDGCRPPGWLNMMNTRNNRENGL
jgi:hypothetical protein